MRTLVTLSFSVLISFSVWSQTTSEKWAIRLSADVSENPPSIRLSWPPNTTDDGYRLYRRNLGDATWGNPIASPSISDTQYTDNNVETGKAYEYKIMRFGGAYIRGFGYIFSGIKYPEISNRGGLILLVDENYKSSLQTEIEQLKTDMISDGWQVYTLYASRDSHVPDVKARIKKIYENKPDVRALFILGHVPVPWSGNFVVPPDGHVVGSGNHTDAWPADVYYADLDDDWTDNVVNAQTAGRELAWNVPGDGKFDQTQIPSEVELETGRVDLFNMNEFSDNDTLLIKQYLQKDHDFKTGKIVAKRRGFIDDNFGSLNLASTGWDNFAAFFGHWNIEKKDYITTLRNESYLWSYGCGGGSFISCAGLNNGSRAYSKDFASDSIHTIFTMLAGSFFGDWDNPNNFLRAPLASKPSALASFWGGIPKWHVFHMAMGFHIGYATRLTQNNTDYTNQYFHGLFNYSQGEVHIALMGDPTLRMYMVPPPTALTSDSIGIVTVKLNWTASTDPAVIGYNIYRARTLNSVYEKINNNLITTTTYTDDKAMNGNNVYMVRAVKLEKNASGSFYNMSLGAIDSASALWPAGINDPVHDGFIVSLYPVPANRYLNLDIESSQQQTVNIRIINQVGQTFYNKSVSLAPGSIHFHLNTAAYPKGMYHVLVTGENKKYFSRKILVMP